MLCINLETNKYMANTSNVYYNVRKRVLRILQGVTPQTTFTPVSCFCFVLTTVPVAGHRFSFKFAMNNGILKAMNAWPSLVQLVGRRTVVLC